MQHDYECYFCIVDLHAITVYQDPAELKSKIEQTAALFFAAGIDPAVASVFVQSAVHGHAELSWLLTCCTPVGWLERMTQYKDKSAKQESVRAGLLMYPVLMAADILIYQANAVPVGEDQSQHLELTRDIAQSFNAKFGDTFVMPETRLPMVGARVMGLDDPTKKMSKSTDNPGHAITLLDPPSVIRKKIMRATTDSNPAVDYESLGAGVENLLSIHQAFTGWTNDQMRAHFHGLRYGDLKKTVAEAVVAGLEPIQKRYAGIMADPSALHKLLDDAASRVSVVADSTVKLVKERMGVYT
jgi:tryptophanyl-tRNA synthetase